MRITIGELLKRLAGDDCEWTDLDIAIVRDMVDDDVEMAVLSGVGKDGRPFIFRLPVEKLRKKK